MRDGLAVSLLGHAALLAWGLFSLPSPEPLDASSIEAIPVNFVQIEDITSVPKGVAVAKAVEEPPPPEPLKKIIQEPPPEPEPAPPPEAAVPPEPLPPLPEPEPLPPEPEPLPPEPEPLPPAPEPLPPEEPPPPPEPEPPPPAPQPEPEAPPPQPEPEKPPPPPEVATVPRPDTVPVPQPRPRMAPSKVARAEPDKFDPDQIAALLDKDKAAPEPQAPSLGAATATAAVDARMTATELDALRARLAQCWSPPIGWTDPNEVRVVLMLSLNPDGTVSGEPGVLERPDGRYAQTAAESALRAVRRCAPYALPSEKYESWKQVKVTFDPTEMGGG